MAAAVGVRGVQTGWRTRLAGAALLAMLTLPGWDALAQKPEEEHFTPAPAPTVSLPRLTPSGGAKSGGPTSGAALRPSPVVAPPMSPVRLPGAAPAAPPAPAPVIATVTPPVAAKPATPTPPPAPIAAPAAPRRTVVTTADVNLRAAPNGNARVLDELERGQRLEVAGPAPDGWVHVGRNGKALGYVADDYVAESKPDSSGNRPALGRYAKASRADNGCALPGDIPAEKRRAPLPVGTVARVLADANLRVAPACDAKVEDVLEGGERVTVLAVVGSWYRVGRKGRALGYVGAALLGAVKGR